MVDIAQEAQKSPVRLSVHILLPETIDRRLERWTKRMPGTSWPAWGGHVTLVPNFVPRGSVEDVIATIQSICANEMPFIVRFAAPIAIQDMTRPGYFAVFLAVEEKQVDEKVLQLQNLRSELLSTLEPFREDISPQLLEQSFLPHVTLALGLAESEARELVQQMRADPLNAEFEVEVIWLMTQSFGEGARIDRLPIPLGPIARLGLLQTIDR